MRLGSGSVSSILRKWKEDKSKSNSDSATAATAITDQPSKSVDEIKQQSAASNVWFHRTFFPQNDTNQSQPSQVDASLRKSFDINNSGSLASKSQHPPLWNDAARLATSIQSQQTQQEEIIEPKLSELPDIDFADVPFDSDVSIDSDNDVIENEVSTEESEQIECDLGIN